MGYDIKTGRLTIMGKDVPTSQELGQKIVEGSKEVGKNAKAIGFTMKEMAEESFKNNPKGNGFVPGLKKGYGLERKKL